MLSTFNLKEESRVIFCKWVVYRHMKAHGIMKEMVETVHIGEYEVETLDKMAANIKELMYDSKKMIDLKRGVGCDIF